MHRGSLMCFCARRSQGDLVDSLRSQNLLSIPKQRATIEPLALKENRDMRKGRKVQVQNLMYVLQMNRAMLHGVRGVSKEKKRATKTIYGEAHHQVITCMMICSLLLGVINYLMMQAHCKKDSTQLRYEFSIG